MTLRSGVLVRFWSFVRWLLADAARQNGEAVLGQFVSIACDPASLSTWHLLIPVYEGPDIHISSRVSERSSCCASRPRLVQ